MTHKTGKMTSGSRSPSAYIELLTKFPPRPISCEEELLATQQVIDSLIDRGELTPDEQDYLNVLGTLVYEYEQLHHQAIPDIHGVELIKAMLSEFELRQKDLVPIFKTESIVSAILNGQRQLTATHIRKLAGFFHISPALAKICSRKLLKIELRNFLENLLQHTILHENLRVVKSSRCRLS